ncbi:MAG: hypothetical protein AB8B69_13165 [Chitinophagales bacterium]
MTKLRIGVIFLVLIVCLQTAMAQNTEIDIEACGKDNNPVLNQAEADYFNLILKEQTGGGTLKENELHLHGVIGANTCEARATILKRMVNQDLSKIQKLPIN